MLQPRMVYSKQRRCISGNKYNQNNNNNNINNNKLTVPLLSSTMLSTVAATSLMSPMRLFNDFTNYLNGITIKSTRKQQQQQMKNKASSAAAATEVSNLATYLLIASITILCCSSTCMAQLSGKLLHFYRNNSFLLK